MTEKAKGLFDGFFGGVCGPGASCAFLIFLILVLLVIGFSSGMGYGGGCY